MTPDAQRIAIAEACGWKYKSNGIRSWGAVIGDLQWHTPTGKPSNFIPDYLNDLNAMHDAESVLLNEQRRKYVELLIAVHPLHYDFRISDDSRMAVYMIVNTSAAQRAEAFLKTLGLWKEKQ